MMIIGILVEKLFVYLCDSFPSETQFESFEIARCVYLDILVSFLVLVLQLGPQTGHISLLAMNKNLEINEVRGRVLYVANLQHAGLSLHR